MPKFNVATIERWEHRVAYNNVEAATLEEAFKLIKSGDVAYDDQEVVECADDVQCIVSASRDGKDITVPPELGMDSIGAPASSQLSPRELVLSDRDRAQLLAALTFWTDYGMVNDDEAERDYFTPPEKPMNGDEISALRDRLEAKPAPPTPESVMVSAMEDRERKIEWDRLQTEYGVPDELWQWVGDGVLQLVNEDEAKKTLTFTGPDNTTLAWIHPDHNAEFCWRYVNVPGDCVNFYLQRCSREHGDEDIDVPTLDDLIAWLENACDE